jgi:hypothetical protein
LPANFGPATVAMDHTTAVIVMTTIAARMMACASQSPLCCDELAQLQCHIIAGGSVRRFTEADFSRDSIASVNRWVVMSENGI